MALLRLGQGRIDAAVAVARRMVEENRGHVSAIRRCSARRGDHARRRGRRSRAGRRCRSGRHRGAADAPPAGRSGVVRVGSVLLAADPAAALAELRRAHVVWWEVDVPYAAAARTPVRDSAPVACRALGDEDAAVLELEGGVRATFDRLGAEPDTAPSRALLEASADPVRR